MEERTLLDDLSTDRISGDRTDEILLGYRKDKLHEEIEDLKQDREQRKIFSYCIFGFMCLYMATSIVIIFLCGLGEMCLKESILIALLTTSPADNHISKRDRRIQFCCQISVSQQIGHLSLFTDRGRKGSCLAPSDWFRSNEYSTLNAAVVCRSLGGLLVQI